MSCSCIHLVSVRVQSIACNIGKNGKNSLNRVPASAGVKAGKSPLPGGR